MEDTLRTLRSRPPSVIAIGGSAGALEALNQLLPALPRKLACPVLLVMHLPAGRDIGLVDVLARGCVLNVCEAADKMPAAAGCVYIAPADYHLLFERDGSLALSIDEPLHYSRPSIDVLFQSVADARGPGALGIILSGASVDGAEGLAAIRTRGGLSWVQAPESASVPKMPEAALALAPHAALSAADMGRALAEWGCGSD